MIKYYDYVLIKNKYCTVKLKIIVIELLLYRIL